MRVEGAFLRSRIARRIVALFVLCAVVPVAAMALLAFDRVRSMLSEQEQSQLLQVNESYGTTVYERLIAVDRQVRTLTASIDEAQRWNADTRQRLAVVFDAVALMHADGRTTNLLGDIGAVPALPAGAAQHLADGEPVVLTAQRAAPPARVFLASRVDRHDGEGTLIVARVRPEYLWGEEGTYAASTDFAVLDDLNHILFSTLDAIPPGLQAFIDQRGTAAAGQFKYEQHGDRQLANFREVFMKPRFFVHGWTIVATRPEAQMLATVDAFKAVLIPAALLALLIVALFSIAQIRRTLIPLEQLTAGTRRAADQDFTVRVEVDATDEFGDLARSFNSMTARLGTQFNALMTLADIDRAILSRLDVDRVLETVVMRMREIVPAEFVSVAVLDRNAGAMLRVYSRDHRTEDGVDIERSTCSEQDTQALLANPEGAWIDASPTPTPYVAPLQRLGARRMFVLPIIWNEAAIGAVVLGFSGEAVLTEEERARARDLGDRVGVAFATAVKDEQLYQQAHYDSLTQLPNRLYFKDQLARRIVHAQRERKRFALLFIDLDHFKKVNDSMGHAAGDDLLRQAADRLRRCVREADAVARLGGMALATGAIAGAEALVRWDHPKRGLLSPLHFIQLAEETGLIEPLGEWVLREACRQFMAWREEGLQLPRVAVNVSARQFKQHDFTSLVEAILRQTGMPANALELEVTETLLMDASRTIEVTLGKLGALGVRIALDDFGTGYSSLGYLKRFPVDIVKIDRSFVKDLPGDESSAAITAAIVAMAHALKKEVIAEGVAEAEQAVFLRRLRCDMMQGFHLSRPLRASEFADFVRGAAAASSLSASSRAA